jgi:sterol desaturase/sphingolipid hydroxylase (fatty acid hydroxylase superfamily)
MNALLLVANVLVLLTFIAHTFGGDIELRLIEPQSEGDLAYKKQKSWLMARGAFHIVSADFLLATLGLSLVNFTDFFKDETFVLQVLSLYFFLYGIGFFIGILISKKIPHTFLTLWQWLLMLIISGLIYFGL